MACPGKKKNGFPCLTTLYRCKSCGNVGCDHTYHECSNQGFQQGRCMKCGKGGQKEPLR